MTGSQGKGKAFTAVVGRVREELQTLFGSTGFHQWSDSAFMRVEGQAVIFVVVSLFSDQPVVNIRCYVVRDIESDDPALGHHLARLNSEQLFGAFSLDQDGDVCYDYTLLGTSVTREALQVAITVIAHTAQVYGPKIISTWGGVSSLEKLQQQMEDIQSDRCEEGPPN